MDNYTGIRVGIDIKLGEELPVDDGLITAIIIMTELKNRSPKVFTVALKAMQGLE